MNRKKLNTLKPNFITKVKNVFSNFEITFAILQWKFACPGTLNRSFLQLSYILLKPKRNL